MFRGSRLLVTSKLLLEAQQLKYRQLPDPIQHLPIIRTLLASSRLACNPLYSDDEPLSGVVGSVLGHLGQTRSGSTLLVGISLPIAGNFNTNVPPKRGEDRGRGRKLGRRAVVEPWPQPEPRRPRKPRHMTRGGVVSAFLFDIGHSEPNNSMPAIFVSLIQTWLESAFGITHISQIL